MKKLAKILSVVLALSMVLAICIMPASAVSDNTYDEKLTIDVQATLDGTDSSDLKIYKIDVYADSTNSLAALQLFLSWDGSAFQLLRNNKKDAGAITPRNIIIEDPASPFYDGDAYSEYDGEFSGDGVHAESRYALFPYDQAAQADISELSDGALGDTLKGKGYTGVYWNWMTEFTKNLLLVSGGQHRGTESPIGGRQKVLSFYVREKAGATPGTYTLGANEEQFSRVSGTYTWNDNMDSKSIPQGTGMGSLEKEWITINNAKITIGDAATGPKVERAKAEIKMTPTGDGRTVEDDFQFRVVSKISDADWKAYLSNTGSSEDKNCLTQLGFVAYKGTENFDMALAQAAAKAGETQGEYEVATTNYVKYTDGSDAEFAARIDTSKGTCEDATYIAFIKYKDAEGTDQYAFYDAECKTPLKTNYDNYVSQYLGRFGN